MISPNGSLRIGLLTTLETNIGDDFIREGILQVVRELARQPIDFVPVNKHKPYTVYPEWHPIHFSYAKSVFKPLRPIAKATLPQFGFSVFDDCDLLIQCGTPIIWPGCKNSEWAELIWSEVLARLGRDGKLVLNLGGGSCYPWERQPTSLVADPDEAFVRLMLETADLTTVRDVLAKKLFASLGYDTRQICCPALLAGQVFVEPAAPTRKVLINYMPGGGHFDWDQNISAAAWQTAMDEILKELRQQEWEPHFLAHDAKELEAVAGLWPDIPRTCPLNCREYFEFVRDAAFGIFNRMHASVAAAGVGVPAIAIGTDTRNLMVSAIGLPVHYVKEANSAKILADIDKIVSNRDEESKRLLKLRSDTFQQYKDVLLPYFSDAGNRAASQHQRHQGAMR